jgi:RNA polymerase sigma-70 factor (ECF subfamily)
MQYTDKTDKDLINESLLNNLEAFEALTKRYQGLIFAYLFNMLGNSADAQDITQETFIKLYSKLSQYNHEKSFKGWLITISRNLAISMKRKRVPTPVDPAIISRAIKKVTDGPEKTAILNEASQETHQAIQKLPEKFKEIIVLFYIMGYSIEKISNTLTISQGTVKSRLFHGKKKLREILIEQETAKKAASSPKAIEGSF